MVNLKNASPAGMAFNRPHVPAGSGNGQPAGGQLWLLQLLRAIAAVMIVVGHSQSAVGRIAAAQGRTFHRWQGLPWGASVDLFFVISGFIMVYASRRLFAEPGAPGDFLARRIARVVPLYWLCTTMLLAILALAADRGGAPLPGAGYLVATYAFIPARSDGGGIFPLLDLGWTLNYEMAFYALFALFIWLPRRRAVAAVAGSILLLAIVGTAMPLRAAPLAFWTRPIMLDFVAGALIGLARLDGRELPGWTRLGLVIAGAAAFGADPMGLFAYRPGVTVANDWPRVLAAGLPAAAVIGGLLLGRQPARPRWLVPAVVLGDASYSLYLLHPFVLMTMEKLVQKVPAVAALPLWLLAVLTVGVACAVAVAAFHLLERPLTLAADRVMKDSRARWRRRREEA